MTDISAWQGKVGQSWADNWRATDRSFSALTKRLIERIGAESFTRALDIGCGAGELALRIGAGHPENAVLGIDVSEALVETARERAKGLANVRFEIADAARWAHTGSEPDLLMSRHGVMFFDEPEAAFANLRANARDGARLAFSCFRDTARNVWYRKLRELVPGGDRAEPPDSPASGPFAFADSGHVEGLLTRAGWRDIGFESVEFHYLVGVGENALDEAVTCFLRIGPIARAIRERSDDARHALVGDLRAMLDRECIDGIIAMPASAWIVTARFC